MGFPWKSFPQTNQKRFCDCCVFKFSDCNGLRCVFRRENALLSNFSGVEWAGPSKITSIPSIRAISSKAFKTSTSSGAAFICTCSVRGNDLTSCALCGSKATQLQYVKNPKDISISVEEPGKMCDLFLRWCANEGLSIL